MTRISDLGLQQILLASFQRAQEGAETRQMQLASGKIANAYSGVGPQTVQLLTAEGVMTRASAYGRAAAVAETRLQTQEAGLSQIADSVARMRDRFVATLATGSAELLMPEIERAAGTVIGALNMRLGDVYVFGGADGTAPPASARTLADIAAAGNTDDLLAGGTRATLIVGEGATISGGATAREIAGGLFAEFKALAEAEGALGPFAGELTGAQRDFLVDMVARLDALAAGLNTELGLNGVGQAQAADAKAQAGRARDLAEIVASEIEDIDIAEVVARLNQDRLAIEAAAQALAQASQLSLLNYI